MSSSQHATGSRKRKASEPDLPVLVQAPDAGCIEEGTVIVGHRVSAGAVRRSGLLAGMAGTTGMTSLPSSISPEDVQLWQAACVIPSQLSTDDLISILKVADVFGDEKLSRWLDTLSDRVLNTQWADSAATDVMLSHLLTLPPHLLHRTLSSSITSTAEKSKDPDYDDLRISEIQPAFCKLYATFPAALHDALIASAVSEGSLDVPNIADANFFLELSRACVLDGGLTSLNLWCDRDFTPATGASLGRAICAHPSLRSVELRTGQGCVRLEALRTLTAGMRCHGGHSSSLTTLSLKIEAHPDVPGALAEFLKAIPSAKDVTLYFCSTDRCQGAGATTQSLRPLVLSAAHPACMRSLVKLSLGGMHDATGNCRLLQLLSLLHAPELSSITLTPTAAHVSRDVLLSTLSRFSALRQLRIETSCHVSTSLPRMAVEVGEATLPALQQLTVCGLCAWQPLRLTHTLAAAAEQTLTRLELHPVWGPGCGTGSGVQIRRSFAQLWAVISRCLKLQHLDVRMLYPCCEWVHVGRFACTKYCNAMPEALRELTQLTSLTLQPGDLECKCDLGTCIVHCGPLAEALQRLRWLQHLNLRRGCWHDSIVFLEPAALLAGWADLKMLRSLALPAVGLQPESVAEVASRLPKLTSIELQDVGQVEQLQGEELSALRDLLPTIQIEFT